MLNIYTGFDSLKKVMLFLLTFYISQRGHFRRIFLSTFNWVATLILLYYIVIGYKLYFDILIGILGNLFHGTIDLIHILILKSYDMVGDSPCILGRKYTFYNSFVLYFCYKSTNISLYTYIFNYKIYPLQIDIYFTSDSYLVIAHNHLNTSNINKYINKMIKKEKIFKYIKW